VAGGLLAVVVTESIQTVVMVGSALALTYLGLKKGGGWHVVTQSVDPHLLTILRPAGDSSGLPWYAVILGYPVIGIWYWCTDQTIVQRVLGAKDSNHARTGALFTGFLKILPVFIFVFPGVILLALVNQKILPAPAHSNQAYIYLLGQILPAGLKGLLVAALLAASMGTVAGALNSAATLFSYDLWRKWKPQSSDRDLVRVGRIGTVIALLAAIIWSPFLGRYPTVFQGINAAISYIAPPVTVIFLFGIFSQRASSAGAIMTLVAGSILGFIVFILDWCKAYTGWSVPFMMAGFYLACICAAVMTVTSLLKPDSFVSARAALVWRHPLDALREEGWPGMGNYKTLTAVLLLVMIALYWHFR
jgi:solute:Na+ symporter, SSS family